MKKTKKRILVAILCALLVSSSLVSCSDTGSDEKAPQQGISQNQQGSQSQNSSDRVETEKPSGSANESTGNTYQDIQADTYKEQISYYMALTESLQAELLKLKEESYIDECEYQLQIETLEQTVQNLKDTIATISKGDINVNSPSSGTNSPSNDQLSSKPEFKYATSDGEVTITEYIGNGLDVKIPSTINGYPVVKVGEGAFKSKQIRSVIIPSGVREIDWFAFSGCTVLESVTIPASVMCVQYGAFEHCPKSLKIICEKGSYIEAYALSWGLNVQAE